MYFNNPEDVIALTPEWKGERLPDGRPYVADKYLDEIRKMTLEELWKPIFVQGYENQFLAMKSLHPEFRENGELNCKMIGRAVTASYGPKRPDYYEASMAQAKSQGYTGTPNQWVIDSLVRMGCDTAKDVLSYTPEEVANRADLEIETVRDVFRILNAEFEQDAE